MRPMIFGEVLFDHFPDGSCVLGGAPFNVAWHLQAFGLAPLFVSRIGADAAGDEVSRSMRAWGMDMSGLQSDTEHATGRVEVSLEGGEPHYEIVDACAYDYIEARELPEPAGDFLLYHGSLALRHEVSSQALERLRQGGFPRFVDINLRPPWWERQRVRDLLHGARWIKLNTDELRLIEPAADDERRLRYLAGEHTAFVALTRGAQGADLIAATQRHKVRPAAQSSVVDVVGAGDAFCSVLVAGIIRGWAWPLMLKRAQDFASAVVGIRGATTADAGFYRPFIEAWSD